MQLLVIILLVCVSALCSVCCLIKVLLKHTTVYFFHIWVWGSSAWQYNIQYTHQVQFQVLFTTLRGQQGAIFSSLLSVGFLGTHPYIFHFLWTPPQKHFYCDMFPWAKQNMSVKPVQDSLFPFSVSKAVFFSQQVEGCTYWSMCVKCESTTARRNRKSILSSLQRRRLKLLFREEQTRSWQLTEALRATAEHRMWSQSETSERQLAEKLQRCRLPLHRNLHKH